MSARNWFIMFVASVFIIVLGIMGLNVAVDPFGAFGDRFFHWYSVNMTNNPKVAKYTYLDKHKGEFSLFILGPSGASGISPAVVEEYTGLKTYNLFNYGADMAYTAKLADYIAASHRPARIILVMPIIAASVYDTPVTSIEYAQPLAENWQREFLLANPKYSFNKMRNFMRRSYFQQPFAVFNAETGTYDKTRRDAEAIGNLTDYVNTYTEFLDIEITPITLAYIDENAEALRYIKALCDEKGIELTVIVPPMYAEEIQFFNAEEVTRFYECLAAITPFWSFVNSDISKDPRYFYDTTHYRNCVGDMMLAEIFGDDCVYRPDNFGQFVTQDNIASAVEAVFSTKYQADNEAVFPILLYHHFAEEADGSATIAIDMFERHLAALQKAGYHAISMEQLYAFVTKGQDLPENPILITADDGYASNYEVLYPLIAQYQMQAAIFVIGVSFGKDTYKQTNQGIIPHFGYEEAIEMAESGFIEISSHTFDMHQVPAYDEDPREGVLRKDGETEEDYIKAFREDWEKERQLLSKINKADFMGFAYPHGLYDVPAATLLCEMGAKLTFTTEAGRATVVKGIPASLLQLKRFSIDGSIDEAALIALIGG